MTLNRISASRFRRKRRRLAPVGLGHTLDTPFNVVAWVVVTVVGIPIISLAQIPDGVPPTNQVVVLSVQGTAEILRAGAVTWTRITSTNELKAGDQLRTGTNSAATVLLADRTIQRIGPNGHLQVLPDPKYGTGLNLFRGLYFFLHRDKPGQLRLQSPAVSAVIRGTEFQIEVRADGSTTLDLMDGVVELANQSGRLDLQSGQAAQVEPGRAPEFRTAAIEAVNVIQWCLYYPAVLDLEELELTADERQILSESIAAYRSGDLLAALGNYPVGREPASAEGKIYLATLLLAVGEVANASRLLEAIRPAGDPDDRSNQLAAALQKLISAVKFQTNDSRLNAHLSTALLAESYYQQAQAKLKEARTMAQLAARRAPNFGFAQVRLAELEFSFGRNREARAAIEKALEVAPRNAQAVALKGFLLAAENRFDQAIALFDGAIALDGRLGNGWLGRGLCRIRRGQSKAGLLDLEVAAATEPQRALLRSYLGKAFGHAGDDNRADHELDLAKRLDPKDPTAWLYSALLRQRDNRINEAVSDLEFSQELNDNRRIYRSQLLLDQDRAVRGANLANVYQDAAMSDVSLREAVRAVNADYANYSAHLFLANSYNQLRDPRLINLRYETPWFSEYLLANLLAPAAAGTLSQTVSQQEYSKLFERDGLGLVSQTEYLSRGDWVQAAAQYGRFGNSAYSVDTYYRNENGQRPNNDLELFSLSLQFKQQLTLQDSLYFQSVYSSFESGDLIPYYDPASAIQGLRVKESQEPVALLGYHHQWSPGAHTVVLASGAQDTFQVFNPQQQTLVWARLSPDEPIAGVDPITIEQRYRSEFELYSMEPQQIFQYGDCTDVFGARFQIGRFHTQNQHANADFPSPPDFPYEPEDVWSDFQRVSAYGYHHWQVLPSFLLVAGLSYDWLRFPVNFRYAPLAEGEDENGQVSPKGGFIWTPATNTVLRAGYSQSLGGVSLDQSIRLEPTQVAGFNQAFRSVIPEAVGGANANASFENWGVSLEQKLFRRTYLAVAGEWLNSSVDREVGVFEFDIGAFTITPTQTPQRLDYQERSLTFSLNQLVGDEWSFGLRYRVSQADLREHWPEIPEAAATADGFTRRRHLEATLHQLNLSAIFTLPSGLFGQLESIWSAQSNDGYEPPLAGDDFWQFNTFAGYRFWRRRVEVRLGLLNITDQDYRLNPLNLTPELSRSRTLFAGLKFSF